MKVSLEWLKDYVNVSLPAERIAAVLSDLGFACEGIERCGSDSVIDLEVTSNRGDCLGYLGVARELAAATGAGLRLPGVELVESGNDVSSFLCVENSEPDLCGRYTARVIEGLTVAPSPDWMRKRLEAVGLRPVNNVVDATNYAMLETGQPPHAFDHERLRGRRVEIRRARAGEELVAIDGTRCRLDDRVLVIADAERPVAIAGVMGGAETEVGGATGVVVLEDASFCPLAVRTASRRFSLDSEAGFRFERGVDIERVDWASKRTARLITQVAGGSVARGVIDLYPGRPTAPEVKLRLSRLNCLLGVDVRRDEVLDTLLRLGFEPRFSNGEVVCRVPSWRADVCREVDLIEEVCRFRGYDKIPMGEKISIQVVGENLRQKLADRICRTLTGCGFYEAVTVSFIEPAVAGLFEPGADFLAASEVSGKATKLLRRSLVGSLMTVIGSNARAGNLPCSFYETADTFVPLEQRGDALPRERASLALASTSDFRRLRGAVEAVVAEVDRDATVVFEPARVPWAEAGAEIIAGGTAVGTAGVVGSGIREKFDLEQVEVAAAELVSR
jgi:phenylalanyl-tRNA synthetase beta chain